MRVESLWEKQVGCGEELKYGNQCWMFTCEVLIGYLSEDVENGCGYSSKVQGSRDMGSSGVISYLTVICI